MFDAAALERRVAALESRAAASLRFGRVTGIEGGQARVELPDGVVQGLTKSCLLPHKERAMAAPTATAPWLGAIPL